MNTLLRLESSGLLREQVAKWSKAMVTADAAAARHQATEIRIGIGVVLANPRVFADFCKRTGLPPDTHPGEAAELAAALFTTITEFTFCAPASGNGAAATR